MIQKDTIYFEDCLEGMKKIPDRSIRSFATCHMELLLVPGILFCPGKNCGHNTCV